MKNTLPHTLQWTHLPTFKHAFHKYSHIYVKDYKITTNGANKSKHKGFFTHFLALDVSTKMWALFLNIFMLRDIYIYMNMKFAQHSSIFQPILLICSSIGKCLTVLFIPFITYWMRVCSEIHLGNYSNYFLLWSGKNKFPMEMANLLF